MKQATPSRAEQAHTPTPWIHRPEINGVYANDPTGPHADGKARLMIADTQGQTWNGGLLSEEQCAANAAFIVTACNAYDSDQAKIAALVALAEGIAHQDEFTADPADKTTNAPNYAEFLNALRKEARAVLNIHAAQQTNENRQ